MNTAELQVKLRHFAAERDWEPFHTPKNLATALMVECAELMEIFQWMTPDESTLARNDATLKQRIDDEVVDVLLYLLQVADHCKVDLDAAIRDKLERNARKHPAKKAVAPAAPTRASEARVHVLLDYENVQPSDPELRALVPNAGQLWVFCGPHQRDVQARYASFADRVTVVPISRTGRNALDFHLSFYMGYIASRNPSSTMIVVANDKGYEPMLEHAGALGFVVRRQPFGMVASGLQPGAANKTPPPRTAVVKVAVRAAGKTADKAAQAPPAKAGKATAKPVGPASNAKRLPGAKAATTGKALAKPMKATAAQLPAAGTADDLANGAAASARALQVRPRHLTAAEFNRIVEHLRKYSSQRPAKPATLRRMVKSLLAVETGDELIEHAYARLVSLGIVSVGANSVLTYSIP